MKFLTAAVLSLCLVSLAQSAPQDDQYVLGPDSQLKKDVPQGKVTQMPGWTNQKNGQRREAALQPW
ncbi:MAG: hypothetical protein Q8M07_12280 [Prosthecobacter sp.]|nr:hypothetical protein [Prosthecobacter sp.]